MPTYQRRDVVCDAVRTIGALHYDGPVELIVVVDGSTDGSHEALEALDCPFPKRIIVQDNAGLAAARNRGAAEASGDIILFLDDDMMCCPDVLEQHARSHAAGADVVLGHIPLDPDSPEGFLSAAAGKWADDRARALKCGVALTLFDLLGGHLSIRRSVFMEVGGFDAGFTHGGAYGDEDLDLGVRLVDRYKIVFNPDAVAKQRYVVTPRQYLRQWGEAGQADVRFARKHPERADELFELHGASRPVSRLLLQPIAASGFLTRILCGGSIWLADREQNLPRAFRRAIAFLFQGARDVAYWSGVRRAGGVPAESKVLVLCYHAIADLSGDPVLHEYGIPPENFSAQLDELLARGFIFITPDELVRALERPGRLPRKAVLLTFDDCYSELLDIAHTVLRPRGIEAIAFAVSGMKSGTNEWDQTIGARRLRLLDADGLKGLRQAGIEIGCHSRTHHPLASMDPRQLCAETVGAADDFPSMGLPRPRFFAYPHGTHDLQARSAVYEAGFTAAFGLLSRQVSKKSDKYALPRVEILARDIGWRFRLKTAAPALAPLTRLRSVAQRLISAGARRVRRFGGSAIDSRPKRAAGLAGSRAREADDRVPSAPAGSRD